MKVTKKLIVLLIKQLNMGNNNSSINQDNLMATPKVVIARRTVSSILSKLKCREHNNIRIANMRISSTRLIHRINLSKDTNNSKSNMSQNPSNKTVIQLHNSNSKSISNNHSNNSRKNQQQQQPPSKRILGNTIVPNQLWNQQLQHSHLLGKYSLKVGCLLDSLSIPSDSPVK